MLSQTKSRKENGFAVRYSSRKEENKENRSRDLVFHVKTREDIKLQFTPSKKGLHIIDCKDYFGVGKDGCVFGKKICAQTTEEEEFLPDGIETIATVEGNNKNFTNQNDSLNQSCSSVLACGWPFD